MSLHIEPGDIVFLKGLEARTVVKAMVGKAEPREGGTQYQAEVISGSDPLLRLLKSPIVVLFGEAQVLDVLKDPKAVKP